MKANQERLNRIKQYINRFLIIEEEEVADEYGSYLTIKIKPNEQANAQALGNNSTQSTKKKK